jgi:hypothetical protein
MTTDEIYLLYKRGSRIVVANNRYSYKNKNLIGKFGTVIENQYGQYGKIIVNLDDEYNLRATGGRFYFKPSELSLVNDSASDIEEDNTMQNITNYVNITKMRFIDGNNSSTYDYANFDPELKEGDLCVVKSAHHGLGIAKVVEFVDQNDIQTQREIVAKVDTTAYDARVANRAKAAELKAKMKERAKQLQDIALYQMLAKDDADMMALLAEYQAIPGM